MTRSDASSIDTIAALVGSFARTDLLTRTKKVSKKDVIDIARLAKDNPTAAIDAYNRGTTGKDIIVALKERLRSKMSEPFPFQIGEPVWVHAKDDRTLFPHSGFWGVVERIYDDSCFCEVTIWSGTIKVRPDNLKTCNHSPDDWAAAAAIMKRLNRLAEVAGEAIIVGLLQELSRRPVTVFSATEEELLSTLEKSFGLPKLESRDSANETNNGNKRSKESNNRVVARNFPFPLKSSQPQSVPSQLGKRAATRIPLGSLLKKVMRSKICLLD